MPININDARITPTGGGVPRRLADFAADVNRIPEQIATAVEAEITTAVSAAEASAQAAAASAAEAATHEAEVTAVAEDLASFYHEVATEADVPAAQAAGHKFIVILDQLP